MFKPITAAFVIAIALAVAAHSPAEDTEQTDITAITKIALDYYQESLAIDQARDRALQPINRAIAQQQTTIRYCKSKPFDEEELARHDQRIEALQHQIELMKLERRLRTLSDESEREKTRLAAEEKIKKLSVKKLERLEPFNEKTQALKKRARVRRNAMETAYAPFFIEGTVGDTKYALSSFAAHPGQAFLAVRWRDPQGNRGAWAHILLRPVTNTRFYAEPKLLNGKHRIQSISDSNISVQAGLAQVRFVPDKPEWKNKDWLAANAGRFVDFDGLAAIQTPPAAEE